MINKSATYNLRLGFKKKKALPASDAEGEQHIAAVAIAFETFSCFFYLP